MKDNNPLVDELDEFDTMDTKVIHDLHYYHEEMMSRHMLGDEYFYHLKSCEYPDMTEL